MHPTATGRPEAVLVAAPPLMLTAAQAATMIGRLVGTTGNPAARSVIDLIKAGELGGLLDGGRWLVPTTACIRYVAARLRDAGLNEDAEVYERALDTWWQTTGALASTPDLL